MELFAALLDEFCVVLGCGLCGKDTDDIGEVVSVVVWWSQ